MSFSDKELNSREEIVMRLRPHWWFFLKQVAAIFLSIAVIVLALLFDMPDWVMIFASGLFIASLLIFGYRYIVWRTTNFVITTDRLVSRSGVFRREGTEIPLERVNTVLFAQTLWERIIGSGDLEIESAGEQGSNKFSDVRKPINIKNEINRQMEANEQRMFTDAARAANPTKAAPAGSSEAATEPVVRQTDTKGEISLVDQIAELDGLKKRGILTDDEFQTKKQELLDRI